MPEASKRVYKDINGGYPSKWEQYSGQGYWAEAGSPEDKLEAGYDYLVPNGLEFRTPFTANAIAPFPGDSLTPPAGLDLRPMTGLPPRYAMKSYGGQTVLEGGESWSWVENPSAAPHAGTWHATWRQPELALGVWQKSAAGQFETGLGRAQPTTEKVALAVNKVRGRRAAFATVMCADAAAKVELGEFIDEPDGTRGFWATINGRRLTLKVNRKGGLWYNLGE